MYCLFSIVLCIVCV